MPTAERLRREQAERAPKMTAQQDHFVDAYIRCGNVTEAALSSGYSKQHAYEGGRRLLLKPHIQAAYQARKARYVAEVVVTAADVLRELVSLAFHDPTSIYGEDGSIRPVSQWPQRTRQAVLQMEVVLKNAEAGDGHTDRVLKVRFESKSKPLELLARHLAMLIDRKEIGGPGAFSGLSDAELATRITDAAGKLARLSQPLITLQAAQDSPMPGDSPIEEPESGAIEP